MYVFDDLSDINNYSTFKREVETPYWIQTKNDEFNRFVGGTTPKEFPLFSESDQENLDKKVEIQTKLKTQDPQSVVFVRQYFWPLFLPEYYNPFENFTRNNEINTQFPIAHTTPCVMRQVAIPIDSYTNRTISKSINPYHNQPQVIETHSWVPWWMLR